MKLSRQRIARLLLALTGLTLQPALASAGGKTPDPERFLDSPPPITADLFPDARALASRSIALFGGVMTDNDWTDFFTPDDIDFGDSIVLGLAASHGIWRLGHRAGLEIEGQIVRHFGEQDHWEFNLPLVGRWHAFPWDRRLDTSIAVGIGPSYATRVPRVEAAQEGSSQRWMVYWLAEIEAGLPSSPWRGTVRIHHRSGAYGVVADEGGSNVLTIGLRRYW